MYRDSCSKTVCHKPCRKIIPQCGHRCRQVCGKACECVEWETCRPKIKAQKPVVRGYETFDQYMARLDRERDEERAAAQAGSRPETSTTGSQPWRAGVQEDIIRDCIAKEWSDWNPEESDDILNEEGLAELEKTRSVRQGQETVIRHTFNKVEVGSDLRRRTVVTQIELLAGPDAGPADEDKESWSGSTIAFDARGSLSDASRVSKVSSNTVAQCKAQDSQGQDPLVDDADDGKSDASDLLLNFDASSVRLATASSKRLELLSINDIPENLVDAGGDKSSEVSSPSLIEDEDLISFN
jgi:hypothetical protein